MAEVNPSKLKLHLRAEKALGLTSLPAKRRSPRAGKATDLAGQAVSPRQALQRPAPPPVSVARPIAPRPSAAPPPAAAFEFALPQLHGDQPFTAAVLSTEEKAAALAAMNAKEVSTCGKCRLCETRTKTVFGEGDPDARLMFIGEGPGENEDLTGRPFVGRAGELLNKQIAAMGFAREQVFIANVVKCRPPNNRAPLPDETGACTPYLMRQIEIVRPRVIVTLGLPSTQFLLETKAPMKSMRGRWHSFRGAEVMPTYHPAYVLRSYTEEVRRMVWDDLKQARDRLAELANEKK